MDNATNFAKVTVDPVGYSSADLSLDLITNDGSKLPTPPFNMVWWNSTDFPDPADAYWALEAEIVTVTEVSTDTLTVDRAQEGTANIDHNTEGKTYQMVACLTARTANMLAPLSYDGILFDVNTKAGGARIGDIDGNGSGTTIILDDTTNHVDITATTNLNGAMLMNGSFGTAASTTATVGVGAIARKLEIFDENGASLGFIPIYASIT